MRLGRRKFRVGELLLLQRRPVRVADDCRDRATEAVRAEASGRDLRFESVPMDHYAGMSPNTKCRKT